MISQRGGRLGHKRLGFVIVMIVGLLVSCGPKEVPISEGTTPRPTNTAVQEVVTPCVDSNEYRVKSLIEFNDRG